LCEAFCGRGPEIVDVVQGALTDELLADIWFAVVVESSVAGLRDSGHSLFPLQLVYRSAGWIWRAFLSMAQHEPGLAAGIVRIPEMLRDFGSVRRFAAAVEADEARRLEKLLQGS